MTLSIIVPVYNVADYLKQCIESILAQTYQDYEIILVDDGSTDESGTICDSYAARYNKVSVYHKKNGGLSSARNYGIDRSQGNYLMFVDSDDWLNETIIEKMMAAILENSADVVSCAFIHYYSEDKQYKSASECEGQEVFQSANAQMKLYTNFSACGKIFRKTLFNDVRFPEGKLYEDARTMYKIALMCQSYVVIPDHGYYYRQRPASIMGTFTTKNYLDRVSVWDEIYDGVKEHFPESEMREIKRRQGKLIMELLKSIVYNKGIRKNQYIVNELLKKLPKGEMNYSIKDKMVLILCKCCFR